MHLQVYSTTHCTCTHTVAGFIKLSKAPHTYCSVAQYRRLQFSSNQYKRSCFIRSFTAALVLLVFYSLQSIVYCWLACIYIYCNTTFIVNIIHKPQNLVFFDKFPSKHVLRLTYFPRLHHVTISF